MIVAREMLAASIAMLFMCAGIVRGVPPKIFCRTGLSPGDRLLYCL